MTDRYKANVERTAQGTVSMELGRVGECVKSEQAGPETVVEEKNTQNTISKALSGLPAKERKVVELFFGLNDGHRHNLREISYRTGVSRERVRQVKNDALEKLKRERGLRELCLTN